MSISKAELGSWINAQYNFIQGVLSIPVVTDEESYRAAKCQGGIEILQALVKALNNEQNNIPSGQAEAPAKEPAQAPAN